MADDVERFITEWRASSGSERANSQPFLIDLCRLLELPPPQKANSIPAKVKKAVIPWPGTLPEQAAAVAAVLAAQSKPVSAEQIAKAFKRAKRERVVELLETLTTLGQVRRLKEGRYSVA